jgi:hypothetical protein
MTMLRSPAIIVWLILVVATVISWTLGTQHIVASSTVVSVCVLVIAFIKVRFVGLYFMELRDAPLPLRTVFEAYCIIVGGAVIGAFLIA